MQEATARLWTEHDRHPGDRHRLFGAVAAAIEASRVLYPGSFVDVAPSFVWPRVTYVDTDRRAARFFADRAGVDEIIERERSTSGRAAWEFLHADYSGELDLGEAGFDLLVSLYAGLVSKHGTQHLRVGGWLLANASHGDVAMASLDGRYELAAAIASRGGDDGVRTADLGRYLVPKRAQEVDVDTIERSGRGIAYSVSAFAYLFRRIA